MGEVTIWRGHPAEQVTTMKAVSYTHLDVYKRQGIDSLKMKSQTLKLPLWLICGLQDLMFHS